MQIPNNVLKSVVFLGAKRHDGSYDFKGTGFWLTRPSTIHGKHWRYLVTAKHIIEGAKSQLASTIGMRVNLHSGGSEWIDLDYDNWHYNETDPNCDVAVFHHVDVHFDIHDYYRYPLDSVVDEAYIKTHQIQPGEEVFSPGLFAKHTGLTQNVPILRTGTLASMEIDDLRVTADCSPMRGYLIESRSIGGLSGSPVFINLGKFRVYPDGLRPTLGSDIYKLLGITWGHFDVPNDLERKSINAGISIVTPATRILEVCTQDKIRGCEEWNERRILGTVKHPVF